MPPRSTYTAKPASGTAGLTSPVLIGHLTWALATLVAWWTLIAP